MRESNIQSVRNTMMYITLGKYSYTYNLDQ